MAETQPRTPKQLARAARRREFFQARLAGEATPGGRISAAAAYAQAAAKDLPAAEADDLADAVVEFIVGRIEC
jgi:hypothetical protein